MYAIRSYYGVALQVVSHLHHDLIHAAIERRQQAGPLEVALCPAEGGFLPVEACLIALHAEGQAGNLALQIDQLLAGRLAGRLRGQGISYNFV